MDMIEAVCGHIHNYFTPAEDIRRGAFRISGGLIDLPFLAEGQYFRLVGSALNDGVYRWPIDPEDETQALADEDFVGEVWPMRVPRAVLRLAKDIEAWQDKYGAAAASPYQSENVIGVYSYTKANAGAGGASSGTGWESAFRNRLNEWRKLR